jgi:hypothetical protein
LHDPKFLLGINARGLLSEEPMKEKERQLKGLCPKCFQIIEMSSPVWSDQKFTFPCGCEQEEKEGGEIPF